MNEGLLIVDNDPSVARSMGFLLKTYGFEVETQTDPTIALERARSLEYLYAVLTDFDLGKQHMNGAQLLQRILEIRDDCFRVIISSSASDPAFVAQMKSHECKPHLIVPKPFDADRLVTDLRVLKSV